MQHVHIPCYIALHIYVYIYIRVNIYTIVYLILSHLSVLKIIHVCVSYTANILAIPAGYGIGKHRVYPY